MGLSKKEAKLNILFFCSFLIVLFSITVSAYSPNAYIVSISPSTVYPTTSVAGTWHYSDVDGDLQDNSTYKWYINNVENETGTMENSHLIMCHFDDTYTCNNGEIGNNVDTSFVSGKYNTSGVLVEGTDYLTYSTTDNYNRSVGTIEMWIKPSWNASIEQTLYLFNEEGTAASINRLYIRQQNAANNYMACGIRSSNSTSHVVTYTTENQWNESNVWHHVACTWNLSAQTMELFIDGESVDDTPTNPSGHWERNVTGSIFWLGSDEGMV